MLEDFILSQLEFEHLTQIKQRMSFLNVKEPSPQATQDELRSNA